MFEPTDALAGGEIADAQAGEVQPAAWMYKGHCGKWFREHRLPDDERRVMPSDVVETPLYVIQPAVPLWKPLATELDGREARAADNACKGRGAGGVRNGLR